MSVMCTYHCRGVLKEVFFFTQRNLLGGRVENHRMMFTWHLYFLQSYIQAVLYIYIYIYIYNPLHDVFNPLHPNIRMHILHTVLYTFPNVLARRICLTMKRFFG